MLSRGFYDSTVQRSDVSTTILYVWTHLITINTGWNQVSKPEHNDGHRLKHIQVAIWDLSDGVHSKDIGL